VSATPHVCGTEVRAATWSKSCGSCWRTYGRAQWETLPAVASLGHASVQAHLSVPAAWTVELRRCTCGTLLAARNP
jgi:hypothetical protein